MAVKEQPCTNHPRGPWRAGERKDEFQRLYNVRRRAQKPLPLGKRFPHELELVRLQIAKAAVDELAARRRRMAGKIVLLDQQNRKAAPRRVARDSNAVDAAPDNQQVEFRLGQAAPSVGREIPLNKTSTIRLAPASQCGPAPAIATPVIARSRSIGSMSSAVMSPLSTARFTSMAADELRRSPEAAVSREASPTMDLKA